MLYSPTPMHVPDGFLSGLVSILFWLVAAAAVALALRRAEADLGERTVPLMGVLAAAIFAGQMLNFPVAGGTSGHLMGAALATILLGPWAAVLVMTAVVGVQALVFQDGGLLALGANITNMAVIGPAVSYFAYRSIKRVAKPGRGGMLAGGFLAGWLSVVIAALAVALELAVSGTSPARLAVPAMAAVHALIGAGEGLITAGAIAFLYAARRDLLDAGAQQVRGGRAVWLGGLAIVLLLAALAPLAAAFPDGLEWVAQQQGFLGRAHAPALSVFPNYVFPGIPSQAAATIVAGVFGALLVGGVALIIAYSRRRRGAEM